MSGATIGSATFFILCLFTLCRSMPSAVVGLPIVKLEHRQQEEPRRQAEWPGECRYSHRSKSAVHCRLHERGDEDSQRGPESRPPPGPIEYRCQRYGRQRCAEAV